MLEDYLLQVNKPARYIGKEWNMPKKDFAAAEIKFALCFPDLYEVGMSNLGIRIIYSILNNIPEVSCERFFAPEVDLENILRHKKEEIFSLESKRPLKVFDLIGFSLASELNYTNVLNILDLGGIPLQASLRDAGYPLVIGGGPCTLNPEPMHDFFDLFIIGEAEDLILELIAAYAKIKDEYKSLKMSKQDLLCSLSKIPGVYAPSLYEVTYNAEGLIEEFKPRIKGLALKIKKRVVEDLNSAFFPVNWLVPYIQIIHDRVTLEIMRGCPNRCRFCQARSQYFPLRERAAGNILELAEAAYRNTGYEEISLVGLSVSDYPNIEGLLRDFIGLFKERAVGVSLPSIKAKAKVGDISSLVAKIKKTGLTFAPEAGSKRLRDMLAKDFAEEDFYRALEKAYLAGYQHVKLYFMIGLPSETEEDLGSIIDFAWRVSELRRKIMRSPAGVNISINVLIPKPHTPFQWLAMQDLETIKSKQEYLRKKSKNRRFKLNFHNREMSFLEGILCRGDRRLSGVIARAFKLGARFDAWANHFNFSAWQQAFQETGIDPYFYLKEKSPDEVLPWDFIDTGISKDNLLSEFNKTIDIQ